MLLFMFKELETWLSVYSVGFILKIGHQTWFQMLCIAKVGSL